MKIEQSDYVHIKFGHPTAPQHELTLTMTNEQYDFWAPVLRALETVINEMREEKTT